MLTFQNITKDEAVRLAEMHRDEDHLAPGIYYSDNGYYWVGCSVGCFVHTNNKPHKCLAELFGTTEEIERLRDFYFENLPEPMAKDWHVKLTEAVPENADVSKVGMFHAARCLRRCLGYIGDGEEGWRVNCRKVIEETVSVLESGRWLTPEEAVKIGEAEVACAADVVEAARAAREGYAMRAAWAEYASDAAYDARVVYTTHAVRNACEREIKTGAADLIELLQQCGT